MDWGLKLSSGRWEQTILRITWDHQDEHFNQTRNKDHFKSHQDINPTSTKALHFFSLLTSNPGRGGGGEEPRTHGQKGKLPVTGEILESGKTKCFPLIATVENSPLSDCNRFCLSVSTTVWGSSVNVFHRSVILKAYSCPFTSTVPLCSALFTVYLFNAF